MTEPVFVRNTCRLCGGRRLSLALRLVPTPPGDHFVPRERLGQVQECYPLDWLLCADCANVQLSHIVNPEIIYKQYTYTTSVSLGLPEHFRRYADDVLSRVHPSADALVVELGSNEGAMLRAFRQYGLRVLGVDPATEIAQQATSAGIETLPAYFTAELGRTIRDQYGQAAVVIANNVLANIDDLDDIARGVCSLLAPDGIFVLETSYCLDVVQKALIDTIFHEHISYFAVRPLARFFERHGLRVFDACCVATKGGSLRLFVQRADGPWPIGPGVAELSAREAGAGLDRLETYRNLGNVLQRRKNELLGLVRQWKAADKTVAAYGAAVGLTTMIYHFGLGEYLSFIADDNPVKQGLFSPGLHLPTLPSKSLDDRRPDYTIVLAWRYVDAIVSKHRDYVAHGGRFVLPLPEVRVLS
jgi:SAM-dependent methyltransferase